MVAQNGKNVVNNQIVHFKKVNFMACQLYLNKLLFRNSMAEN